MGSIGETSKGTVRLSFFQSSKSFSVLRLRTAFIAKFSIRLGNRDQHNSILRRLTLFFHGAARGWCIRPSKKAEVASSNQGDWREVELQKRRQRSAQSQCSANRLRARCRRERSASFAFAINVCAPVIAAVPPRLKGRRVDRQTAWIAPAPFDLSSAVVRNDAVLRESFICPLTMIAIAADCAQLSGQTYYSVRLYFCSVLIFSFQLVYVSLRLYWVSVNICEHFIVALTFFLWCFKIVYVFR